MIDDEDIAEAERLIEQFRTRWPQMGEFPLHSCEIRGKHKNFAWLGIGHDTHGNFVSDLERLLLELPVIGLACVIDRPGYNARYTEKYGRQKWELCKTAFAVAVERAVKYAIRRERRLRVYAERTDKAVDAIMKGYYDTLRSTGHWFNPATSEKYRPLDAEDYRNTLYEFRTKQKTSRLMQIADLYLWPICMGGYESKNHPYSRLLAAGKLIECHVKPDDISAYGTKYSCFEETAPAAA